MSRLRKKKTSSKQTVIHLKDISKAYTLHYQKPTLSEQLFKREVKEKFQALKKVSLKIYEGEKVGIMGRNGSGKTTLLKIISGITAQTGGTVTTRGKVISLIHLNSGFHIDLTGHENIFLNGMLLGMSKKEITEKLSSIIDFAGLGNFIHAPLHTYSEGMKLRLGFSVAIHGEPDILILDEEIVAGDKEFQKKAVKKIDELFRANKTIIVVTHWLDFLAKHCQRFIWMENGKVKEDGDLVVIQNYKKSGG
jgi:ABC-type polysaccharide/polyol phosphate transport system ATPase subunit